MTSDQKEALLSARSACKAAEDALFQIAVSGVTAQRVLVLAARAEYLVEMAHRLRNAPPEGSEFGAEGGGR